MLFLAEASRHAKVADGGGGLRLHVVVFARTTGRFCPVIVVKRLSVVVVVSLFRGVFIGIVLVCVPASSGAREGPRGAGHITVPRWVVVPSCASPCSIGRWLIIRRRRCRRV